MVLVLGILIAPLSGLKCPYIAIKHNNIGYVIIVSHGITLHQVWLQRGLCSSLRAGQDEFWNEGSDPAALPAKGNKTQNPNNVFPGGASRRGVDSAIRASRTSQQ